MEVGDDGDLDERRVRSSIIRLWRLLISELRIFISISRFIPYLMSFGLIPKP